MALEDAECSCDDVVRPTMGNASDFKGDDSQLKGYDRAIPPSPEEHRSESSIEIESVSCNSSAEDLSNDVSTSFRLTYESMEELMKVI